MTYILIHKDRGVAEITLDTSDMITDIGDVITEDHLRSLSQRIPSQSYI